MDIVELARLLVIALIALALHLGFLALSYAIGEPGYNESRWGRIKVATRNLVTILLLIAPLLIILWKVALS